jgi:hypothetical protein
VTSGSLGWDSSRWPSLATNSDILSLPLPLKEIPNSPSPCNSSLLRVQLREKREGSGRDPVWSLFHKTSP